MFEDVTSGGICEGTCEGVKGMCEGICEGVRFRLMGAGLGLMRVMSFGVGPPAHSNSQKLAPW